MLDRDGKVVSETTTPQVIGCDEEILGDWFSIFTLLKSIRDTLSNIFRKKRVLHENQLFPK